MNEKLIEKKLVAGVNKLGGWALKWVSWFFTGMPDRIVLMPGGRIFFAEIKTAGKGLTRRQKIVIPQLIALGFSVSIIDDQQKLNAFLKMIAK